MVRKLEYLIIIGFSRSGTTSLYNYLADHPEINVGKRKELNFFNSIKLNPFVNTAELRAQYDLEFIHHNGVKIDATPAYISSRSNLELLSSVLRSTEYRVVILVRDRYDRINSWINYARMKGIIKSSDKIEDLLLNRNHRVSEEALSLFRQQHMLNYYANVVEMIQSVIPMENIIIIRNRDLNGNPRSTLTRLAIKLGLLSDFYSNYNFKSYNESKGNRLFGIFLGLKKRLRKVYSPKYMRFFARYFKKIASPNLRNIDKFKQSSTLKIKYNEKFKLDEFELVTKFNKLFLDEN
jgi:hypothetical protein